MTAGRNAQVVRLYLDAIIGGDLTAIDRYLTPDVEYISVGIHPELNAVLPWTGRHCGWDRVRDFFLRIGKSVSLTDYVVQEVIEAGDTVAAFGTFKALTLPTNKAYITDWAISFKMRNGQIAMCHFFENSYGAAADSRCSGSWVIENDGRTRTVP